MTINPIAAGTSLLISAVKPLPAVPAPALDATGNKNTPAPEIKGQLNTFALAVLTQTLESQQGLLDNQNPNDSNVTGIVVGAAVSLAQTQQATSAYEQAKAIAQEVTNPIVNINA